MVSLILSDLALVELSEVHSVEYWTCCSEDSSLDTVSGNWTL